MRRIALGLLGCLMLAATGCCCNHNLCGMSSGDPCGWDACGSCCTTGFDACSMDCCGSSLGCGTTVGYSPSCSAPSCAAPSCAAPAYSAMPTHCPECAAPAPTTYRGAYLSPPLQSQAAPPVVHAPVTYDTSWQTLPASTPSTLNEPAALPAVPAY
jgi:hypothetical protein